MVSYRSEDRKERKGFGCVFCEEWERCVCVLLKDFSAVDFGTPSQYKDKIGWATSRAMYLGRTQYTVMMYDSLADNKNTKPWNVTFFDYSSHTMAPDVSKEYGKYLAITRIGLLSALLSYK